MMQFVCGLLLIVYFIQGIAATQLSDQTPPYRQATWSVSSPVDRAPLLGHPQPAATRSAQHLSKRETSIDCHQELGFIVYQERSFGTVMKFTSTFTAKSHDIDYFGWLINNKYVYIYMDGRNTVDKLNGIVRSVWDREESGIMSTTLSINTKQLAEHRRENVIGLSMQLNNRVTCAQEMAVNAGLDADCPPDMGFDFYFEAITDSIMIFNANFARTTQDIKQFAWMVDNHYGCAFIEGRVYPDLINGVSCFVRIREESGNISTSLLVNTDQLSQSKNEHLIGLSMELNTGIICAKEMTMSVKHWPLRIENHLDNNGIDPASTFCPLTIGIEMKVVALSTVTVCRCTFQANVEDVTYLGWVVRGRYMLLYSLLQNQLAKKAIDDEKVYHEKLSSHHNQITSLVVMEREDEDIKLSLVLSDGRLCLVTATVVDRDDTPASAMLCSAVRMTNINFGYALVCYILARYCLNMSN